jgi:hypothetical protein
MSGTLLSLGYVFHAFVGYYYLLLASGLCSTGAGDALDIESHAFYFTDIGGGRHNGL